MRIILTRQKIELEEREVEFKEGDLVLLEREKSSTLTLGVFQRLGQVSTRSFKKTRDGIRLGGLYTLHPEEFFGETSIPLISRRINREHTYDISRGDVSFYIGQEEIVRKLRDTLGFTSHADLVSTFEEPYLRRLRLG